LKRFPVIRKTSRPGWIVVVYAGAGELNKAELEKAKTEYKEKHPDWKERDFNVIWVPDEETKQLTERIIAGEGSKYGEKTT
jgi:hypothetical protein